MSSSSVASVGEDVVRENDSVQLREIDLASRKAEEASLRRNEAAEWLRKIVGIVVSKDMPAEPSEDDFSLSLRSGIILCTAINKVQPGAVPKVVEAPNNSVISPDGAALMAYQYFENLRNFAVAMDRMGLTTFEASDIEQGGKTSRVVNCVLALKAYYERKISGCSGSSKYQAKSFARKNSERFTNTIVSSSSIGEKPGDSLDDEIITELDINDLCNTQYLGTVVRSLIVNKKQEEIPIIVESMMNKVIKEYERRLSAHNVSVKTIPDTMSISGQNMSPTGSPMAVTEGDYDAATEHISEIEQVNGEESNVTKVDISNLEHVEELKSDGEASKSHDLMKQMGGITKQKKLVEQQKNDIQELKVTVNAAKESMKLLQTQYQEEFIHLGKHIQFLASAASGYRKVLEENRKLYNQVQDLKGNIRVYCRVRPFLPGQAGNMKTVDHIEEGSITILTPSKSGKDVKKSFNFNRVFGPNVTQAEVYADMQPLVRSVLDGFNVCIFAYGQTGAGKTYTMTGPNNLTEETYGVNYRALNDLFEIARQRKDTFVYEISVQMMEIYNEQVRDLLATDGSNKRLEIHNSSHNGINVPDANRLPVSTTSDVINLMNLGHKNRVVCSTSMNDRSSRSHSCMTVHIHGKDLTSGANIQSSMHLVDLAGSERVDKSEVTGDRLKEATHINKSLSALGDVMASLASKSPHVPYRNSKLTQLLQDSLGGQAKTLMFVHIRTEADAVGETIGTLKFAERVSSIELGAARTNKDSSEVRDLKEQIASLKAALIRREDDTECSFVSTPETMSVKSSSTASSPMHPSSRVSKDGSLHRRRRSMEDVVGDLKCLDSEVLITDENDEFDVMSDTSEPDVHVQLSKTSSLPNGSGTKMKARGKGTKNNLERKSSIPTPSPRKSSSGVNQSTSNKTGKQGAKRKTGNSK